VRKTLLLAALLLPALSAARAQEVVAPVAAPAALPTVSGTASDPFLRTIVSDPTHPKLSARLLFTSKFVADGGVTDVALVYHKHDGLEPWPAVLENAGIVCPSFTLLEVGAGGNAASAFVDAGLSVNIAPTLLTPLTSALKTAGGTAAVVGNLLVAPDGSGLSLGFGWKSNVIDNRALVRFDDLRFPPRYSVGYTWQF
jgi:hypothetical protein